MDHSKSSDLLQSRLRERKAENARANKLKLQQTPNRDDAIFDAEPDSPKANMSKHYQTPPSDFARHQHNKSGSRRGSNMGASRETPRAMGLREMEEHVDKLSKQNFDLKLEVYHRRERIEELEKKLAQQAHVAEENAELLQINEDLLAQLETRDMAVDEAVVQICDLEETVRSLEEQLAQRRQPSTYRRISNSDDSAPPVNRRESKSRSKAASPKQAKESTRTKVSPEVSARMATLATPEKTVKAIQPPAFLQDNQPSTLALRSLFVDGDKSIRPIPSYASLLSRQTALDAEELQNEVLRSPRFSVLSESDLRSIYGPDKDEIYPKNSAKVIIEDATPKGMHPTEASRQRKLARVNRWVEDGAVTPVAPTRLKRTPKVLNSDQFQSLGGVLHQEGDQVEAKSQPKTKKVNSDSLTVVHPSKPHRTPPMPTQPLFGQNYFPPTPDTMITQTLSHSSSSIGPESRKNDAAAVPPRNFGPQIPPNQQTTSASAQTKTSAVARSSFLPQELDSYVDGDLSDGNDPYLVNTYGSDESTSLGSPQHPSQSPTRSSPSPEQLFKSRRRPAPIIPSPTTDRPPILRVSTNNRGQYPDPLSSQSSPYSSPQGQFPSFAQADRGGSLADTQSLLPKTPPKPSQPLYADNIPHYRSQSQTQQTYPTNTNQQFPTSPTAVYNDASPNTQTKSPPSAFLQRSGSLRNRVARLTRRNSNSRPSTVNGTAGEPSPPLNGSFSGPEDQSVRKRGIRNIFFPRRSSSAHPATPSSTVSSTVVDRTSRMSNDGARASLNLEHHQQPYALQPRGHIAMPNTYTPLQPGPTGSASSSGRGSSQNARYFTPSSSADEISNANALAIPASRPARGRSPPPATERQLSDSSSSRKRFSFSGSRVGVSVGLVGAAVRNGSSVALRSPGPGSGSETEGDGSFFAGQGRQRSGSFRLRDMDGTGAGRWMK